MNNDLSLSLPSLESGHLTRDEFISVVETCNKIINDAETFNQHIIDEANDFNFPTRSFYTKRYNISVEDIPGFKLPGYNVPAMNKNLSVTSSTTGLKKIHDTWVKNQHIHKYNNDPDGTRHIAPLNVNISSVIALNLVCDVIEGSYQINLEQQQRGRIGKLFLKNRLKPQNGK